MKYLLITSLAFTTIGCTSNTTIDSSTFNYALVNGSGTQLSAHKDQNECIGAEIKQNIRYVNEFKAVNKSHERAKTRLVKAVCKKI